MPMVPELDGIYSIDLPGGPPELPGDPENCWIILQADIGIREKMGADTFTFYVTTHESLQSHSIPVEKANIVLDRFDWAIVESDIKRRCGRARGSTWEQLAMSIEGEWEFDGHEPCDNK